MTGSLIGGGLGEVCVGLGVGVGAGFPRHDRPRPGWLGGWLGVGGLGSLAGLLLSPPHPTLGTDADDAAADDLSQMSLVSQQQVFESCGQGILDDYLEGSPVVLFAYGLSGSGKTYTVFGPDAPSATDAWYRFSSPQSQWGIFPRVAYEVFRLKQPGWTVTLKYVGRMRGFFWGGGSTT